MPIAGTFGGDVGTKKGSRERSTDGSTRERVFGIVYAKAGSA